MIAGLKILAWFDLKEFVTINFPTHLAEFDPALWGGENALSSINKICVNVCVCLCAICVSDFLSDVNCNKSSGVPDGTARQKTRSTGCNCTGWEILTLGHLLAGIFVQGLAC